MEVALNKVFWKPVHGSDTMIWKNLCLYLEFVWRDCNENLEKLILLSTLWLSFWLMLRVSEPCFLLTHNVTRTRSAFDPSLEDLQIILFHTKTGKGVFRKQVVKIPLCKPKKDRWRQTPLYWLNFMENIRQQYPSHFFFAGTDGKRLNSTRLNTFFRTTLNKWKNEIRKTNRKLFDIISIKKFTYHFLRSTGLGVGYDSGIRVTSLKFTSRHSKNSSVTEQSYLSKSKENAVRETRHCWNSLEDLDNLKLYQFDVCNI